MDFANERYVRFYTRDTVGYKLLGWQGRHVFAELYRKADRSGVVDLGGAQPWEAAVLLGDMPEEVAQVGMQKCLARGWIVVDGDRLVFPKYIEANECAQSDAQRQRESRAKRAAVTSVTKRDDQSQNVTDCHGQSHDVTSCHSVPSRAVPFLTDPAVPPQNAPAREEQAPFQREDFGGGSITREKARGPDVAARGARWLSDATGQERFGHAGNWAPFLVDLDGKPDAEKRAAAVVLRVEAEDPDVVGMLNPKHVSDWWHCYGQGKAPGKRAANGFKRRGSGPSRGPTREEHARDEEEVAPWDR